ncbi:MAG TPA: hypothetical protein VF538_05860 [Pyrinomonadaceae bacterium]|jgi:hypothetical protein
MKRNLVLTLALVFGTNCSSRSASRVNKITKENRDAVQAAASATPTPAEKVSEFSGGTKKTKDVPPEFSGIDFRNHTYPISSTRDWRNSRTTLIDGSYEHADRKEASFGTLDFKDVEYEDVDGDGKKEAIVQLVQVECGASCDGGAILFYFYAIQRGKLTLLRRISTGSLAYGCGLKSFTPGKGTLTFEVFRECSYSGGAFDSKQQLGKFEAHEFTRFTFDVARGRFALKKREVLPNPSGEVLH